MSNSEFNLIQGNEACVMAALAAGCNFFAGYPITPSSEIMELMSKELPLKEGVFIQMEDEIASISAVLGASLAGAKSMTATSGPGFSLMQENLGFAVMAEIPAVIFNVQRLGPSTGAPTLTAQGDMMQAKWGSHGDYEIIAFSPSSVADCFYLTVKAFNYSEKYRVPVIILLEEIIGHLRESVILPEKEEIDIINREKPQGRPSSRYRHFRAEENGVPVMANYGEGYRFHVTGLIHDETGFPVTGNNAEIEKLLNRLRNKILNNREDFTLYESLLTDDATSLIIAYGSSVRPSMAAIKMARKKDIKAGLLVLKTIWPFPGKIVKEMCMDKNLIIVPEHNFGQISGEVKKLLDTEKIISVNQTDGTLMRPEKIFAYL